jgi:lipopolysaccharide export LptBFGC system permease protein LptF
LDCANYDLQRSKECYNGISNLKPKAADMEVSFFDFFFATPLCLVASAFALIYGGYRFVNGRKLVGGIIWCFGCFLWVSGFGALLLGGPINFWRAMLSQI